MTISEIKIKTIKKAPYFFDRKTLKFFGQSMSSFKVVKSKSGKTFIYAPIRDSRGVKSGFSVREYKNGDLASTKIPRTATTATDVKTYLKKQ
mgnify:CR=1 FL=1